MSNKRTIHHFLTIGGAQHKRSQKGDLGFVHPKHTRDSLFLDRLSSMPTDPEQKQTWIDSKITSLSTIFKSYKEIYTLCRDHDKLIGLLSDGKKGFISAHFDQLRASSPISASTIGILWDNLIYQGIENTSGLVSETLINALLLDHIIDSIRANESIGEDKKLQEKLENAHVLIPGKIVSQAKTQNQVSDEDETIYSKPLADQLIIATRKRQIQELEEAKEAISRAISEYNDDVAQELDEHMENTNTLIMEERTTNGLVQNSSSIGFQSGESSSGSSPQNAYQNDLQSQINDNINALNSAQYAALPGVQQLTTMATSSHLSPAVKAQISSFSPTVSLDEAYIESTSNQKAAKTYSKYAEKAGKNKASVVGLIDKEIAKKAQSIGKMTAAAQLVIKVGNTAVTLPDRPSEDMFAIVLKSSTDAKEEETKYALHITQYFKAKTSEAMSFDVTVTPPEASAESQSSNKAFYSNEHYTTFVLFEDGLVFDPEGTGTASGTVKLRNGKSITFNFSDLKVDEVFMAKPNYGTGTLEDGEKPELYGVTNVGIATFRRVEQRLKRYVLGEISDIQTAEAGTFKNRKVKWLNRSTRLSEDSSLAAREISNELATNSSTNTSEEAQQSSAQSSSKDYGFSASVSGELGFGSFSVGSQANFSQTNSREESNRQAIEQAREVSQTLSERLTSEITSLRSTEVISEREETEEIGFDHTEATEDRSSVYRWVDKIMENKVVNYGARLMYEFMIPEPALNFKASLEDSDSIPSDIILLEKPNTLKKLGLDSPNDLTRENYLMFASAYGAEVESPPMAQLNVGKGLSHSGSGDGLNGYHHTKTMEVTIPEGYECFGVSWAAGVKRVDGGGWGEATMDVGARSWSLFTDYPHMSVHKAGMWGSVVSNTLPVSIRSKWVGNFNMNVIAHCRPSDQMVNAWKLETFNAIRLAYEQKVRDFNASLEDTEKESLNDFSVNSYMARALEKRELTRSGLELVTEPFNIRMARNNYKAKNANNISKINKDLGFERHASHVKFLEQAFEWNIMAYKFYPYYWADESKWHELMNTTNKGDIIFQAFLQAGMARAVVPVRPGFEKAVMFYMETGLIWNGQGYTLDQDDDLYLSVVDELKVPESEIDETWETRLPTNFRVINKVDGPFGKDGEIVL